MKTRSLLFVALMVFSSFAQASRYYGRELNVEYELESIFPSPVFRHGVVFYGNDVEITRDHKSSERKAHSDVSYYNRWFELLPDRLFDVSGQGGRVHVSLVD